MAVSTAESSPQTIKVFDGTTTAQLANSARYGLNGTWTLVQLKVGTTVTESNWAWFKPKPQMRFRAERAANVLTIKFYLEDIDAYAALSDPDATDFEKLIFPCTDTSAVYLHLYQSGMMQL